MFPSYTILVFFVFKNIFLFYASHSHKINIRLSFKFHDLFFYIFLRYVKISREKDINNN